MPISEIIAQLQSLQDEHGDLPVYLQLDYGQIELNFNDRVVDVQEEWKRTDSITLPKRFVNNQGY